MEQWVEDNLGPIDDQTQDGSKFTFKVGAKNYTWDSSKNVTGIKVKVGNQEYLMAEKDMINELPGYPAGSFAAVTIGKTTVVKAGTSTLENGAAYELGYYELKDIAEVTADGGKGAYTGAYGTENVLQNAGKTRSFAKTGDAVTVEVTTKTAAKAGTDSITLDGVTGGNAATAQTAAAQGGKITFTFEMGNADTTPVITVDHKDAAL